MPQTIRSLFFALVCASSVARAASGGEPLTISHSGYLLDGTDHAQSGAFAMKFRIYDADAGLSGTLHWEGACAGVSVAGGYYTVVLGSSQCTGSTAGGLDPTLDTSDLPTTAARWLEVEIEGVALTPRLAVSTVPTAAVANRALEADKLGGHLPGDFALASTLGTLATKNTIATGDISGAVAIANGGTGATNAAGALSALGAAPLDSPSFLGLATAPTAAAGTNTTQLATTAFVLGQAATTTPAADGTAAAGSATTFARADHVHPTDTSRAPAAGSTAITTLGTIGTGTWTATGIGPAYGGTGLASYATGDLLYASGTNTLGKLAAGTNGHVLTLAGGVPTWAPPAASGASLSAANTFTSLNTFSVGVKVGNTVDNTCDDTKAGTIRWTGTAFQGCVGTAGGWATLTSTVLGTVTNPALSCAAIRATGQLTDGVYWLDPDGVASGTAFQAYCDLNRDGGGWMLVYRRFDNVARNLSYNYVYGSPAWGADYSLDRSLVTTMTFTAIMVANYANASNQVPSNASKISGFGTKQYKTADNSLTGWSITNILGTTLTTTGPYWNWGGYVSNTAGWAAPSTNSTARAADGSSSNDGWGFTEAGGALYAGPGNTAWHGSTKVAIFIR